MEKIRYDLGGTEFSSKAARWFAALNKAVGSTCRYEEWNTDQWGRSFGHHGELVANSKEDLEKGLKILESSGRFERIPGDPTTLACWISPSRGKDAFSFNMERQNLANKAAKKFKLSAHQWSKLANGEKVFIGESLLSKQDTLLGYKNGAFKCFIQILGSAWYWKPSLEIHRCDGGGCWEELDL